MDIKLWIEIINKIIMPVVFGVISVFILPWIGKNLTPWIKANTSKRQREAIDDWLIKTMQALEVLMDWPGAGKDRQKLVLDIAKAQGIDIDEEDLKLLIEANMPKILDIRRDLLENKLLIKEIREDLDKEGIK